MKVFFLIGFLFWLSVGMAQDIPYAKIEAHVKRAAYEDGLAAYKEILQSLNTQQQPEDYAKCQLGAALCETRMAFIDDSEQRLEALSQFLIQSELKNKNLQGKLLNLRAENLLQKGRNDEAIQLLEQVMSIIEEENALLADNYNLQGVSHWNNGNTNLALQYHMRAMKIRETTADEPLALADSDNNIGLIYLTRDPALAEEYFGKALAVYEEILGENHPKVAFCRINLARTNSLQNDFFSALDQIQKVREIWEKNIEGDHPNKAFTLVVSGDILAQQNNLQGAIDTYQSALSMYQAIYGKKHPEVANTYFQIGAAYQKLDEFKMALTYYQEAIFSNLIDQDFSSNYDHPKTEGYFNADYLLSAMLAKAKALEAIHFERSLKPRDLKHAIETYQLADDLLESIRRNRPIEKDKLDLGATSRIIYDNAIRLCLVLSDQPFAKKKYYELAYRFLERSKASVLKDAIQDTHAKSYAGIPDDIILLEDSLKNEITYYQRQISAGKDLDENGQKLFAYQNEHRNLVEEMEQNYPQYFNLKYGETDFSLEDIQRHLEPGQLILNYFVTEEMVYIFQVSDRKLNIETRDKPENYRRLIKGLRNSLKYNAEAAIVEQASQLYGLLIPENAINYHDLLILPDGELNDIPFETLYHVEQGKFLLEQYLISYNFSTSLIMQEQRNNASETDQILLIAPIDFESMGSLPGTQKEVQILSDMFTSKQFQVDLKMREAATESSLKKNSLEQYGYLHFATHGIVDEERPELSGIFLRHDDENDGVFYAGDIYNTTIKADMVTLSACETGLGQQVTGEGLLGLSRAFTYAGAQNLLVSLWKVADASTSTLMVDFYRHHLLDPEAHTFKESLRYAKLQLLKSDRYGSPYYWAPFVLIGQ